MFSTELCETFDAGYPIMNAGMGRVAFGDLAGAVSAAGGIGVIGASTMTPEQLEREIDRAWERSAGPLVVDILFPHRAPDDESDIEVPDDIPDPIEALRRELEEKGATVPGYDEVEVSAFSREDARALLEVALDRDVDAIASAVGTPDWVAERTHDAGAKLVSLAGRPRHAEYAVEAGADMIVADGTEGGGHSGPVSTLDLVPMIRRAVDVPVVAAGGIVNGEQIVASLALGAVGVWMGTRFIPTEESAADPGLKRGIVETENSDATIRSELGDGFYIRMLENRFTRVWEGHEDEIRDYPEQALLIAPIREAADEADVDEYKLLPAGQGSALIDGDDDFPSVDEVMAELVDGTERAYGELSSIFEGRSR